MTLAQSRNRAVVKLKWHKAEHAPQFKTESNKKYNICESNYIYLINMQSTQYTLVKKRKGKKKEKRNKPKHHQKCLKSCNYV